MQLNYSEIRNIGNLTEFEPCPLEKPIFTPNYASQLPPVKILMAEYLFLAFDSEKGLDTAERDKVARLTMDLKTLAISKDICKMAQVLIRSK